MNFIEKQLRKENIFISKMGIYNSEVLFHDYIFDIIISILYNRQCTICHMI